MELTCEHCGAPYKASPADGRKYCSRTCGYAGRNLPTGAAHHNWKGDAVGEVGARLRAWKKVPSGPCEVCGKPNAHRHHVDRNILNNDPSNIRLLCASHHRALHNREDGVQFQAKLDETQVAEIKRALQDGASPVSLAEAFGVHATTIRSIRSGRLWRHVIEGDKAA
jgi:hypothetical protein